ncbi:Oidioi.mRNA.OKI2018_I69.XSR.g15525.t1.cds [Oikopleura dioica]|uniref:Oidioi.mRNA.OKI2018_I69.XSR.g15525.t1.cds n=1 Tax=Oikopleura dioica TaxID=34765 RepID=A0ABN7SMC5_OIKDI|nr:Oidioi.mRNA.OKI2018_I69.XSR.g15525.t1.cds [Oikopleura dioica]
METSSSGDGKKELTGRARRKMSKMLKQPASIIVEEDSDARLNVSELVEKRRSELEAMLNIIHDPPSTRSALQRISRCKRRRASAHNLKRLPKSVRTLIVTNEYTERAGLKSYKRRKLAKRELLFKEGNQSENVNTPSRLATHVWFAKRFHMIVKFGWHLPLCPTEKKLKHCMKICAGKVPGTVGFDFSFIKKRDDEQEKNLSRMILIGTLAEEMCANSKVVVDQELQAGYVIAYMENENATKFITELIMSKNGHVGGLELWQLHRCARGSLTFPDDFPDCEEGRKVIKAELGRIDTQYRRK